MTERNICSIEISSCPIFVGVLIVLFLAYQREEPQVSGRESASERDAYIIEDLMQNHDILLSGLRSRLTKLQVFFCFTLARKASLHARETVLSP